MTGNSLIALLPIIVLATACIVLMLVIAINRNFKLAWRCSVAGVILSLLSLPIAVEVIPTTATTLMLIDRYALLFSGLLLIIGGYTLIFGYRYFKVREGENEEFFLLTLIALLGAITLVSSNHFASFFIGLETLSVSIFALIAYPSQQRRSLEAAFKYLLLSGVSSAFLLFGMALIYAETGALAFSAMSPLLNSGGQLSYSLIGIIMILIAMGFKLSLAPFHMWTPDVYQGAPLPATAFVASVSKGAIMALWLRLFMTLELYNSEILLAITSFLAIATMMTGNLLALLQNNIKRMLAYSSIAHLGYILVIFCASFTSDSRLVSESLMFYLLVYMLTTLGSFCVVTALSPAHREAETLEDYTGLFWRQPWLATQFTILLLALAGIPLTAGFIAKFYVFIVGVQSHLWLMLWFVVLGSGMGLFYYLRVIREMLKQPMDGQTGDSNENTALPTMEWIAQTILIVIIIWLGILPGDFMTLLGSVSQTIG